MVLPRRILPLVAIALLAPAIAPRAASADPEELDRRLKSAGVDGSLREKTHRSIDRAVEFLMKRQQPDGHFEEHAPSGARLSPQTVTLFCALALRHVGTAPTDDAVVRATNYLFDGDAARVSEIESRVVEAGVALALIASTGGREALAKRLSEGLVSALDEDSGWWGGSTRSGASGSGASAPPATSRPSLEASQFAVLGLLAARRLGIAVPSAVWTRHARALVETQTEKYHSWPLFASDKGGIGTTVGTLMGYGNLVAAASALRDAPPDAQLSSRVAKAIEQARSVMGRDGGRTYSDPRGHFEVLGDEQGLESPQGPPPFEVVGKQSGRRDPAAPGDGAYSRLFAAERACRFDDVESLEVFPEGKPVFSKTKPKTARLPCYATAARWLVGMQHKDGAWSPDADDAKDPSSETDTALALLVLTRAASAFHPKNPAPIDAKSRPPSKPAGPPAPAMGG